MVDPDLIKKTVTAAFADNAAAAPPPTTAAASSPTTPTSPTSPTTPSTSAPTGPKTTITVNNGTRTTGLALKVSGALFSQGITVAKTGNGGNNVAHTTIRYGASAGDQAKKIQTALGTATAPTTDKSLPADSIVVTLGYDYKLPPDKPVSSAPSGTSGSSSGSSGPSGDSADSSGLNSGGALDMSSQNGIPCVY